jgi:hypothetical protein
LGKKSEILDNGIVTTKRAEDTKNRIKYDFEVIAQARCPGLRVAAN